jgi:hypothetical protein
MDEHFDPVVLRLIELLKKAMPDCAEEDIFWGYHFVTGALMLTLARTGRIDKLSGGLCKSDDFDRGEGTHGGVHGRRASCTVRARKPREARAGFPNGNTSVKDIH